MIRLKAKCGLIIEFSMSDEVKEYELVNKYSLGSMNNSTLLKLGKYGNIAVGDILDMSYIRNPTPSSTSKDDYFNIGDIFNGFGKNFR